MTREEKYNTLYALTCLANAAWGDAYETLKKVKTETNDGSLEWESFHQARLESAQKDEAKAKVVYDGALKWLPELST